MTSVQYEKLSASDLYARFDELTRSSLGLGADTFLERCRQHTLDMTSPLVSRLAMLARLVDEAERPKS